VSWLLPMGLTLAAVGLTYVCCVRPMMPDKTSRTASLTDGSGASPTQSGNGGFETRVNQLRAEIERTRQVDAPAPNTVRARDLGGNAAPSA